MKKREMIKKYRGDSFGSKRAFVALIFILEVILIFAFIDYGVHTLDSKFKVPAPYFTDKIIYGTLAGFIIYLFVRKKKTLVKSFILSAVLAVLLQLRDYYIGYSLGFVSLFFLIHFAILFVVSYIGMKLTRM